MRGRKPKDIAMKLLVGNPSKRKAQDSAEPDPFVCERVCKPEALSERESQEWDRLTTTLAPILSRASEGILLVAVQAFGQMMEADQVIQAKGLTYESHGEAGTIVRMRPEVRIRDTARAAYHRALLELGASPVAQTRVRKLPDAKLRKTTGAARFFTS